MQGGLGAKVGGDEVRIALLSSVDDTLHHLPPAIGGIALALKTAWRLRFNKDEYHPLLAKSGGPKAWSRFGLQSSSINRKDSRVARSASLSNHLSI